MHETITHTMVCFYMRTFAYVVTSKELFYWMVVDIVVSMTADTMSWWLHWYIIVALWSSTHISLFPMLPSGAGSLL